MKSKSLLNSKFQNLLWKGLTNQNFKEDYSLITTEDLTKESITDKNLSFQKSNLSLQRKIVHK